MVTTANDTKNIPMTKHHSDGTKAWKGLLGVMCMDYEMQKKNKKEGDRGEQYKI